MALVIGSLYRAYTKLVTESQDPRTSSLPFMGSAIYPLGIIGAYLVFILKISPVLMKNRKPFNLDKIMIVYNAFQVVFSIFLLRESFRLFIFKNDWRCALVDKSNTKEALYICKLVWCYHVLKIIDLLDTVFFVLRKKTNQVSFLHTYHHCGMIAITWVATKFLPGGHCVYLGAVNSFVHAVMYSYYLLTAYDTTYKQNIWWKKHITQLQIVQFVLLIFLYGQVLFRPDCAFPKVPIAMFMPQNVFILVLFLEFYYTAYIKKKTNVLLHQDLKAKLKNN